MPADSLPTVAEVLTRLRSKLDEPLDAATNFWTDTELLDYLNEGCREVWQQARETHEQWFVRTIASTDGELTIGGQSYSPAALQLTDGATALPLPPDFHELLYLEPLPDSSGNDTGVAFTFAPVTGELYRSLARGPGPSTAGSYAYDIEWRETGPFLVLAPEVALDADVNVRIKYVRGARPFASTDSFADSGFNYLLIDAVLAYAEYEAHRKEKEGKNIAVAQGRWQEKQTLVTRASGPRTADPEIVTGFLESELD